ncbi:hypothetical protein RQP46_010425 [Phenoliferia psychrophenolica]
MTIAKEYTSSIHNVNEQPAEIRPVILLDIKEDAPWWDDLHSILRDHPAFPALKDDGGAAAGGGAAGGGAAVAGPGPAAMAHAAAGLGAVIDLLNDDTDDEDDAMQGVQYHYQKHPAAPPHHFPQPAAALQPHDLLAQQAAAFAFVANHAAALANPPPPPPPNPNLNPVAPPPLSPPPNPQPIPQSPEQTHCYNCQLVLDPATATEHMRRCFDGLEAGGELSGVFMSECIICKTDLEALSTRDRAKHIDECVSKGIIPEEFDVFVATERTRPQEKDGRPKACGMCLEDFESGERLVRLGCLCVFHEHCATAWWAPKADGKQGKFCMVHTEDAVNMPIYYRPRPKPRPVEQPKAKKSRKVKIKPVAQDHEVKIKPVAQGHNPRALITTVKFCDEMKRLVPDGGAIGLDCYINTSTSSGS